MSRRRLISTTLVALACATVAACGGGQAAPTTTTTTTAPTTTTTTPPTTTTTAPTTTTIPVKQMCQVAGPEGVTDGGYHEMVWAGLGRARDQLGVEAVFRASPEPAAHRANIEAFIAEGCDLIVTVGVAMAADTAQAACEFPEQLFAIVGEVPAAGIGSPWSGVGGDLLCDFSNVRSLTFATEEAAFLAGYLAAGLSESGVVGTFGSIDTPPVNALMEAFGRGVLYYNEIEDAEVQVLGWDPEDPGAWQFAVDESPAEGAALVAALAEGGADYILPVVGVPAVSAVAAAALDGEARLIGLGVDWALVDPDTAEVWLTSLLEKADLAVFDTVAGVVEDGDPGGPYRGDLANRGVGLAPYHEFEAAVPAALADAVDLLEADIAAAGGLAAFLAAGG